MAEQSLRLGILTGGGDCPGLNAVIRAFVRRALLEENVSVVGVKNGWRGLLDNDLTELTRASVTGILPRDAARYRSLELVERPGMVAVIARGSLDGDPRATVITRYELRPCDPGVRVRTEIFNGGRTLSTWFLADAWWWGEG